MQVGETQGKLLRINMENVENKGDIHTKKRKYKKSSETN